MVRAAVAEGIVYSRVTTTPMPDVWVEGKAVADVIHLLAELVDNATSFSPPQAQVEIRAGLVGKGVAVEVEDRGLGMEPAQRQELNALLHQAPDFDILALSDDSRLGMFVVARLASTHGITVTLDASPYGGTRAIVLLPTTMLAGSPEAGTLPDAGRDGSSDPRPGATSDAEAEPVREPVPDGAALVGAVRGDTAGGPAVPRSADRTDAPDTRPLRPSTLLVARRSPAQFPAASPAEGPTEASRRSGPPQQADPRLEGRPPLPKRTRQANLAPGLRGGQEAADPADPEESEDTPWYREDVRGRLNAFRQGTTLGRTADTASVGDDAEHRSPDEGANP